MVTNTAGGATTETASKENGECAKDNSVNEDYSNLKQNCEDYPKITQTEKIVVAPQNEATNTNSMSQIPIDQNEGTNYNAVSAANGLPGTTGTGNARPYGNGVPVTSAMSVNGPLVAAPPPQSAVPSSYANYSPYNHHSTAYPGKSGVPPGRQMPNPAYPPSMSQRYPNQQGVATPTLNQLLTTPSRYPTQYTGYTNHSASQQQPDYSQGGSQTWQPRPQQQYPRAQLDHQMKPDAAGGYPQQQYPLPLQHPGYPPSQTRYHGPSPNPQQPQPSYNQSQQQYSGNTSMPPPGQTGYPPSSTPSRHTPYSGYPAYNSAQQSPYYGQRHPQPFGYPSSSYPGPTAAPGPSSGPAVGENRSYANTNTEQHPASQPSLDSSASSHPMSKDHMMSPNRRTPQPTPHPGSVQSPMNPSASPHIHHGQHPSVAQLRGPSPAPGSPATGSQSRGTPLSPPSVRPGTPQQQLPMRSASEHSDHSSALGHSPMSGQNYGQFRPHSQQPYGSQPPNYPQHMISPQQHSSTPQPQQPSVRPHGPPSGGKPAHQMHSAGNNQNFPSQQSPAYQQPGYNESSPAPAERRPSRQGSHPSAALMSEQQSRQGAAAAAHAAMVAAAHTAQPGSTSGQKNPTGGYYPQHQPRPPHSNYSNVQPGSDQYHQTMGYPRMPPGPPTSGPPQRMMGPPGMGSPQSQAVRMVTPSSHYQPGYGPTGPPQQSHYPGYYPQSSGDSGHHPGMHPGYPTPPNNYDGTPHPPEEPVKKTSARSASQKLATLYEPADEPGRREFIDGILRYWEEKEYPLKNAPLMGRKTLDLYRLYQLVKERGFMQEVTSNKKWTDISSLMGLGTSPSSGFTLKKQYCKYLYGFECKMERGEPEPQEALARIAELNRKRKNQEQHHKEEAKSATPSPAPQSSPSVPPTPRHPTPAPSAAQRLPTHQQYPPGQFPPPPQMGPQYRPPGQGGYMGQPPISSQPHPASYPQHPPGGVPPRPGATLMPGYHPGQTPVSTYASQLPLPSGFPPQTPPVGPPVPPAASAGPVANTEISGSKSSEFPPPPDTSTSEAKPPNNADPKLSMKPPVPADNVLAAANPFGDSKTSKITAPTPSYPAPHSGPLQSQQYPPYPTHDPYRSNYPLRPGMPQSHYPYTNSPHPHARPSGPSHPGLMQAGHPPQVPSPRVSGAYPASTPGMSRPSYPRPGQYPGAQSPYAGMKRSSSDMYGPPSKYSRPDGHLPHPSSSAPYPPNHPSFNEHDSYMRHRFPSSSSLPTHVTYSSPTPNLGIHGPSTPARAHHQGYSHARIDTSVRSSVRWPHPSMHQRTNSPLTHVFPKYLNDPRALMRRQTPGRGPHQSKKPEIYNFPPDSVEATPLRGIKLSRKTCQDVSLTEAWRLVMALKSGLLVESTWALNALTVLLYDNQSVTQLKLPQLPGLLDALVDHYRCCLSEIFTLPNEQDALGVLLYGNVTYAAKDEEVFEDNFPIVKPALTCRKKKGCIASSRLNGKFTTFPIKLEPRTDPFLVDNSDQWDCNKPKTLLDDLSHIVLSFFPEKLGEVKVRKQEPPSNFSDGVMVVEATLEDVLSIPCSVLSPDDFYISKSTSDPGKHPSFDNTSKKELLEAGDVPKTGETEKLNTSLQEPQTETSSNSDKDNSETSKDDNKSENSNNKDVENMSEEDFESNPASSDPNSTCTVENSNDTLTQTDISDENQIPSPDISSKSESLKDINDNTYSKIETNKSPHLHNGNSLDHINEGQKDKSMDVKNNHSTDAKTNCKVEKKELLVEEENTMQASPMCNGIQDSDASNSATDVTDFKDVKEEDNKTEEKSEKKEERHTEVEVEISKDQLKVKTEPIASPSISLKRSVISRVEKVLEERNVILLEDEAIGCNGNLMDVISGPLMCAKLSERKNELANRLQCISNIIRGLSFIPSNTGELCRQRSLMRAISGTLLLRHKHRTRPKRAHKVYHEEDEKIKLQDDQLDVTEACEKPSQLSAEVKVEGHLLDDNDPNFPLPESKQEKPNCTSKHLIKTSDPPERKVRTSELFAPEPEAKVEVKRKKKCHFSSTVYDCEDNDDVYSDPWWWDCVRKTREDSLVVLANIAPSLDLSELPDDNVPLALLEACLHWSVCPSSDACDPFSAKSKYFLSVQRLALEILTKLSIKDQNVDLMLATRPFSRIEKLFAYLVNLICDRRDPTLREFAIVLLSNLSMGESVAARAIALQSGAISSLIAFLEECEETGVSSRRMFPGQMAINCGTTVFMMVKAARTLLALAKITENKQSFIKFQLRLLSLSMSQILGHDVTPIISAVLYELTHDIS
ncbi:AT-rich interactive domain-containing protein 1A-like isoform X2 [Clavelina lepadiformis]|uniref:AT-rich interactive domain-containing protein 1A-like isoform X2 n=1 Tax=Clavelina lepadiformis TaxID=159417 RepID=UPI0040426265